MKKPEEKENGERWLLTYADLITLLMIFFVVMYAMSNVDQAKYEQLASSLNSAMGSGGSTPTMIGAGGPSTAVVGVDSVALDGSSSEASTQAEQTKLQGIKEQVDSYLKKNGLDGSASATIQERGLAISIQDTLIFDSGKADLKAGTEAKILEIGRMLSSIDNYINVEGNTDSVAINTYEFKDNWALASSRADNVLRVLLKAGIQPARISSKSNGESRPIASNDTVEGKAANRRVDIVILDNKFSTSESAKAK